MLDTFIAYLILLRLHYNLLILSGGFLVGILFVSAIDYPKAVISFFITQILLMGGMNLFNSVYDQDTTPIGGVYKPPSVPRDALVLSLGFQCVAIFGLALFINLLAGLIGLIAAGLSVLYSHPRWRWKGNPILSLWAVGVGNFLLVLLGFVSSGGEVQSGLIWLTALAFSMLTLAFYPISQVYQMEVDKKRLDKTFALSYGLVGIKKFFLMAFILGCLFLYFSLKSLNYVVANWYLLIASVVGGLIFQQLSSLQGTSHDYALVMRIKLIGGISLSSLAIGLLIFR